jgi:CDP-glucose 4,6-dehydratase
MENFNNLKKFWNKKRVFITGHTGFKGTWLCIILNYLNSKIIGYSLKPKKNSFFNKTNIEKKLSSNYYLNVSNINKLKKKIKLSNPEIIFHLAAQPLVIESYKNPLKTFKTNFIGTLNLLECIRDIKSVKSVVIITTDKVYKISKKNKIFKEDDELGGYDPYSASKVSAEVVTSSYIKSFFQNSNLKGRVSTARSGNVIGGGDFTKNRLVPDIMYSINKNKNLTVRNPNHVRPWQHVLDPLVGYLILAQKQYENKMITSEHSWNFGPNNSNFKKVIEIVNYFKKHFNFKFKLSKKQNFKETKTLKLNSSKAKKKLKWKPRWNLIQAINNTIDWNNCFKTGISAKKICEQQFLRYINKQ